MNIKFYKDKYKDLIVYLRKNFILKEDSIHGYMHWKRVFENGYQIINSNKKIDAEIVFLFSIIHDTKRVNEYKDILHAERAAESLKLLKKLHYINLNKDRYKILDYAIRNHEKGDVSDNVTIGCCWDSDRLDLFRVGIIPAKKYFSTHAGKKILNSKLYEINPFYIEDFDNNII